MRLYNPVLGLGFLGLQELLQLLGQDVGLGQEVEVGFTMSDL